jgi:hypothetical protein
LLEPSLRSIGGHYLPYAEQILTAAEEAGFQPVLVTHRRLPLTVTFPPAWRIYRVFPSIVGGIHRVAPEAHAGMRRSLRHSIRRMADDLKASWGYLRFWRNRSRIRGFAKACHKVFSIESLAPGDIVHCATATDTEVLGLVEFLLGSKESQVAEWHLQFHFRIFRGRDPEFALQKKRTSRLERRLAAALESVPHHRIFFHATTETLARQLRWIKLHEVDYLPWPVKIPFHPKQEKPPKLTSDGDTARQHPPRRLRIVVAGATRPEKGTSGLFTLSPLAAQVQLVLQVPSSDIQQMEWIRRSPKNHNIAICNTIDQWDRPEFLSADVLCVPHPLPSDQYYQLILNSDVGLLPYDADEYFARCSGVLIEFLSAGVPVIGPAGCWLGDQIEQENQVYYQQLWQSLGRAADNESLPSDVREPALPATLVNLHEQDRRMQVPSNCKSCVDRRFLAIDRAGTRIRLDIDPTLPQDILVRIDGLESAEPGLYLQAHLEADFVHPRRLCTEIPGSSHLVGYVSRRNAQAPSDPETKSMYVLLAWDPPTAAGSTPSTSMQLQTGPALTIGGDPAPSAFLILQPLLESAHLPLSLCVSCLTAPAMHGHLPRGLNGRTFTDQNDISMSLSEVVANFAHYRSGARAGADQWRQRHDPHQTIMRLRQRRTKWI